MRRLNLILIVGLLPLLAHAQQAENAAVVKQNEMLKEYGRPSVTSVFLDRGGSLAQRLTQYLQRVNVPGKFDDHSIAGNVITGQFDYETLPEQLQQSVTKNVVAGWFPYDSEAGNFSTRVIEQRGLYNATDADVIEAGASVLKEAMLKDAGLALIERSYIVVYDPFEVKPFYSETRDKKTGETTVVKGFNADVNVYVYQLDWTSEVSQRFYDRWPEAGAIQASDFPARKVTSLFIPKAFGGHVVSSRKTVTEEDDLAALAIYVMTEAYMKMTVAIEDFKVKVPVFAVRPIRAKIGVKEGVSVDQRYFIYELRMKKNSDEVIPVRKGVVRATGNIVNNEAIATGEGGTTRFYQTYGKNIKAGMLMQHRPDLGVGLSALASPNEFSALLEISAGMYVGRFLRMSKSPSGVKVYGRLTFPFTPMEVDGEKIQLTSEKGKTGDVNGTILSLGLSKELYFAHYFSFTPYIGYAVAGVSSDYSDSFKAYYKAHKKTTGGIDAGANFNIAVLHNIQLIGQFGYNSVKGVWYPNNFLYGVGLRGQF